MNQLNPTAPDLEYLKKQAKSLLKAAKAGESNAIIRFAVLGILRSAKISASDASSIAFKLADAQLVIAREHGFDSWTRLRQFIEQNVVGSFFAAVAEGRLRKSKTLLREFPKLLTERAPGSDLLPIQIAAQAGHADICRLLFESVKPRILNTSEFLPFENGVGHEVWSMINAAFTGDLSQIKALVNKSPNLVNCYYDYQTPIHLAVVNGHDDVAEFLLEHGADPTVNNYMFGDSLVTSAADRMNGRLQGLLQSALQKRFEHYVPGAHAILTEAPQNDLNAIRARLKAAPNEVNICTEDGNTPLHIAAQGLNFELAQLLVGRGADLNAANGIGFKPIDVALYRNNYWFRREKGRKLAAYLYENGTTQNITLAATFGDHKRVRELLGHRYRP